MKSTLLPNSDGHGDGYWAYDRDENRRHYRRCHRYQAYVTNLDLPPVEVWRIYRGRVDCENRLEELKHDFALSGFCLDSFYGTEAAFRTVMVAYRATPS